MCRFRGALREEADLSVQCVNAHPTDMTKLGTGSAVEVELAFSSLCGFPASCKLTRSCQKEPVQKIGEVSPKPRTQTLGCFCFFFLQKQQIKKQLFTQETCRGSLKVKHIGTHIKQKRMHKAIRKPRGKQKPKKFSCLHANDVYLHKRLLLCSALYTI